MRAGLLLTMAALTASAALLTQMIRRGLPDVWLVVLTAVLLGAAAAWPVASRPAGPSLPACGECGYPSWASVEMHFCIRCGSHRVWQLR